MVWHNFFMFMVIIRVYEKVTKNIWSILPLYVSSFFTI